MNSLSYVVKLFLLGLSVINYKYSPLWLFLPCPYYGPNCVPSKIYMLIFNTQNLNTSGPQNVYAIGTGAFTDVTKLK